MNNEEIIIIILLILFSKIRFSVFDNKLLKIFRVKITIFNNDNLSYFSEIKIL